MADPRGKGGWGPVLPPPPLFEFFFFFLFTKTKFTIKELYVVLNEYESCLKILEMAILETHIFKNFWRSMPPDPPESSRLRRSLCSSSFESPGPTRNITRPAILQPWHLCVLDRWSYKYYMYEFRRAIT